MCLWKHDDDIGAFAPALLKSSTVSQSMCAPIFKEGGLWLCRSW